jgi:hypothetical protein
MDATRHATDLDPAGGLALIILTGHGTGGSDWTPLHERLRDLARALDAGDAPRAGSALRAAREALDSLSRATTQSVADAETIGVALDRVESLLTPTSPTAGAAADAPIEPT